LCSTIWIYKCNYVCPGVGFVPPKEADNIAPGVNPGKPFSIKTPGFHPGRSSLALSGPYRRNERVASRWEIIEKDTIDEIIFRTTKTRNRLILELMAGGGMHIGEVLKLRLKDIEERKRILREPKSGKEHEIVFIPRKVADRLRNYANSAQFPFLKKDSSRIQRCTPFFGFFSL
jgi:hypothetical protein